MTAGEQVQDVIAAGRLGGYNFAAGPARVFVRKDDADHARQILADVEQGPAPHDSA